MPIILGIIAVLAAAWFWTNRARNAANMAGDLADMATDVLGAARRFGFRRKANVHPVDSLEDAGVATAALGIGFLELAGLPSAEQHSALVVSLQSTLGMSHDQAKEAVILGRWLVTECGGPVPGVDRLGRRLWKLKGAQGFQPMLSVLRDVAGVGGAEMSPRQRDALAGLATVFRVN
jgi:hypothetical protein